MGGRIFILPQRNIILDFVYYLFSPILRFPWALNYEFYFERANLFTLRFLISIILILWAVTGIVHKKNQTTKIIIALLGTSFASCLLARIFFFKLYFPYRYLYPLVIALALGLGIGIIKTCEKFGKYASFFSFILLISYFSTIHNFFK